MSEYLFKSNPLLEELINNDEEYRYAYAEDFLNTYIATQIKVLRDQRGKMTQKELADAIGTQQPGIARLENVNYSKWKVETLKKIARALGVRLKISFETFGTLLEEDCEFSRETLKRPPFEEDPILFPAAEEIPVVPTALTELKARTPDFPSVPLSENKADRQRRALLPILDEPVGV